MWLQPQRALRILSQRVRIAHPWLGACLNHPNVICRLTANQCECLAPGAAELRNKRRLLSPLVLSEKRGPVHSCVEHTARGAARGLSPRSCTICHLEVNSANHSGPGCDSLSASGLVCVVLFVSFLFYLLLILFSFSPPFFPRCIVLERVPTSNSPSGGSNGR